MLSSSVNSTLTDKHTLRGKLQSGAVLYKYTCTSKCQSSGPVTVVSATARSNVSHSQPEKLIQHNDAAAIRNAVAGQFQYTVRRQRAPKSDNPVSDFVTKVHMAWKIFFPDKPKELSPKEEVKRRLRMVLVADRCGMSPASLTDMKKTIVKALQDFVDIEGEESIEVSISNEPGLGTVYSVNIPVRRVKAESRFDDVTAGGAPEGITMEWDPADLDSDPSCRFPMGC